MKLNNTINTLLFLISLFPVLFLSCRASKPEMAIPDKFSRQAIKMQIDGIGNGSGKRPIHFGNYTTSKIKRGWNITSSRYDRNTRVTAEERVLRAFKLDKKSVTVTNKDKFQFTLQTPNEFAEIYAIERQVTENTRLEINSRIVDNWDILKNAQYSFSAAVLIGKDSIKDQWQLVMYAERDPSKYKEKNIFERSAWQHEEGFATNGQDTLMIRGVKIDKVVSAKGSQTTLPFAVMKAYEFRAGDEVSAIVDTFGNNIWMYNGLEDQTRFIIASISSAILLRRIGMF